MNWLKRLMIGVVAFIILVFIGLSWYKYQYSMEVIEPYTINDPTMDQKILIASQGSDFKYHLTDSLVAYFKQQPVHISIQDVSNLPIINENDWDAIIIIHTWENWSPEKNAKEFVGRVKDYDKLIIVSTSGEGRKKMKKLDGISSASQLEEIVSITNEVVVRTDNILNKIVKN